MSHIIKNELHTLIGVLEGLEQEWKGHVAAEKLGGNVVKEAQYSGTFAGIRIAIMVLSERINMIRQAEATQAGPQDREFLRRRPAELAI